jgi:hypothetical protein
MPWQSILLQEFHSAFRSLNSDENSRNPHSRHSLWFDVTCARTCNNLLGVQLHPPNYLRLSFVMLNRHLKEQRRTRKSPAASSAWLVGAGGSWPPGNRRPSTKRGVGWPWCCRAGAGEVHPDEEEEPKSLGTSATRFSDPTDDPREADITENGWSAPLFGT